ncbi:MAG: EAL domain-containing protein [Deltaproteobacteria bacterium]|nr:EAL domain-containing protein [Deltaproteobacteria bacterium]
MTSRVLLVDDDDAVLRAFQRTLANSGFQVQTARNALQAIDLIKERAFDAIVSDVSMPGMDGLELLHTIREHDSSVPVVLVTGGPTVESAAKAVELGALRYLVKPVNLDDFRAAVSHAVQTRRMEVQRDAVEMVKAATRDADLKASLNGCFDSALKQLWMAFQPIVSWREKRIIGYEALVRSDEAALPHPGKLFDAAERLQRLYDLDRSIRNQVAEAVVRLPEAIDMFVNLHAADLLDDHLYDAQSPLSKVASHVVLEVTERAPIESMVDLQDRLVALRRLGFRVAVDDLGAGYASLSIFAQLLPEVAKIDMSLVRGVEKNPARLTVIQAIFELCAKLGARVVTEGVETLAERDTLTGAGCDLLQGYLFAKPGRDFPPVVF